MQYEILIANKICFLAQSKVPNTQNSGHELEVVPRLPLSSTTYLLLYLARIYLYNFICKSSSLVKNCKCYMSDLILSFCMFEYLFFQLVRLCICLSLLFAAMDSFSLWDVSSFFLRVCRPWSQLLLSRTYEERQRHAKKLHAARSAAEFKQIIADFKAIADGIMPPTVFRNWTQFLGRIFSYYICICPEQGDFF